MTKESLLEVLREDTNLSQVCVTRLWKYILKGCHDLSAFSRYSDNDILKIYAQNNYGKKPFAGKDFFDVAHAAQKIVIESALADKKRTEEENAARAHEEEIENKRNPKIRVRVLKSVLALCELAGMTDDDVVDWDKMMMTADAFCINLDDHIKSAR